MQVSNPRTELGCRTFLDEQCHDVAMVRAHGAVQDRLAGYVALSVHVGTVVDKHPGDVGVVALGGHLERTGTELAPGVHLGATLQQQEDQTDITCTTQPSDARLS